MRNAARAVMSCAGFFMISGCIPMMGAAGGAAAVNAPSWIETIQGIAEGIKILSETSKLACAVQDAANKAGNVKLSQDAGKLCVW